MKSEPNKFNKRFKEFYPTKEELLAIGLDKFRTATVHETMGPNWKHIYWTPGTSKRPLVKK